MNKWGKENWQREYTNDFLFKIYRDKIFISISFLGCMFCLTRYYKSAELFITYIQDKYECNWAKRNNLFYGSINVDIEFIYTYLAYYSKTVNLQKTQLSFHFIIIISFYNKNVSFYISNNLPTG